MGFHRRAGKGARAHMDPRILRHSLRNRLLTLLRNDTAADLVRDLPAILPMDALRLVEVGLLAPSVLLGLAGAARGARRALAARRVIQGRRTVSRAAIRRWLAPYPYRAALRRGLRRA